MFVSVKQYFDSYLDAYRGLSTAAWILALVMFVNQSGSMVLPFLAVYMSVVLDFSLQNTGIVLSVFGIGSIIGSFAGGWLTDRLGAYKIQSASLFLSIPFYIILPVFKNFESLCLAVFLLSLFKEIFRPANSASVSYYAKPENLTRAFSLNRMALNLGYSIGPAIGGFLAAVSYDLLFYANGITSFCAGVLFVFYFRNKKGTQREEEIQNEEKILTSTKKIKSAYADYVFVLFSVCIMLFAFCFFQILNILPLFYKNVAMLNEKEVGMLMGFNGIIVFLLEMALVHYAERKLSLRYNLLSGTLICAFAYLVLIPSHSLWVLYLSVFIISISEILVMPFASTVAVNRSSTLNRGSYMGLNALSFSTAFVTAPLIGTMIAENFGFTVLWTVNIFMIILACIGIYFVMKKM